MTRQRLDQLQAALEKAGWSLLSPDECEESSPNPFVLDDDEILWALRKPGVGDVLLRFQAFRPVGAGAYQLRDISYCVDLRTGKKLLFDKIQSREWNEDLVEFVTRLGEAD